MDQTEEERLLWRTVWGLKIKNKVQHFRWRLIQNKLPVEINLKKRGVQIEGPCKQCGEGLETVEHLLFHCAKAKLVWRISPVRLTGLEQYSVKANDWWLELSKAARKKDIKDRIELTAYLMLHLWKARNK